VAPPDSSSWIAVIALLPVASAVVNIFIASAIQGDPLADWATWLGILALGGLAISAAEVAG